MYKVREFFSYFSENPKTRVRLRDTFDLKPRRRPLRQTDMERWWVKVDGKVVRNRSHACHSKWISMRMYLGGFHLSYNYRRITCGPWRFDLQKKLHNE